VSGPGALLWSDEWCAERRLDGISDHRLAYLGCELAGVGANWRRARGRGAVRADDVRRRQCDA